MSQDLNPSACSSLVMFMYWACENHTFNTTPTEICNSIPSFFAMNHLLHVLFVKVVPGTTFTTWSKHHFVTIGKTEQRAHKTSRCGTKQQWRCHVLLIVFLLVRATWVLLFMHIPFVVNRTFTTTPTERLQHLQQGWARPFETTESERDKQNAKWENLDTNNLQSNLSNNYEHHFLTYRVPFDGMLGSGHQFK